MCAVWLRLISIACVSCSAMSGPGSSRVVWKDVGGSVTIHCRPPEPDQGYLDLRKGLEKERILYLAKPPSKPTFNEKLSARLQCNAYDFPQVDVIITNLTSEDTGPYLCVYKKFDKSTFKEVEGNGSILLVVRDAVQQCDAPKTELVSNNLMLVSVVISAVVLLGIIIAICIFIIKTKMQSTSAKPRRAPNNDVYEEMRGTIRR